MNSVFLLFVIFISNTGYEEMNQASDMQFASAASCQAELEHYQNTKNIIYFCGDADLYFNEKQTFY